MFKKHLLPALIATAVILPLPLLALVISGELRACMQPAIEQRESQLLEATREYNQEIEAAMEERRAAMVDAWSAEDDRSVWDRDRAAVQRYSERERAARDRKSQREREIQSDYSAADRSCREQDRTRQDEERRRQYEEERLQREEERRRRDEETRNNFRPTPPPPSSFTPPPPSFTPPPPSYTPPPPSNGGRDPNKCISSNQCGSGQVCTTEYGDCQSYCSSPFDLCPAVCAGTCVPGQSRFSSSFSNSYYSPQQQYYSPQQYNSPYYYPYSYDPYYCKTHPC